MGEEADDLIKDANGGNDILIGRGGDDQLYGSDIYALRLRIFKNRVKQKRNINLFATAA
jgi:Ca2+-binding RTX toxin-like protein